MVKIGDGASAPWAPWAHDRAQDYRCTCPPDHASLPGNCRGPLQTEAGRLHRWATHARERLHSSRCCRKYYCHEICQARL